MSCFTVQVLEPSKKIIEVETCGGDTVSSVVVENLSFPNIELSQCLAQLPADFNDRIIAVASGLAPSQTNISLNGLSGILVTQNNTNYNLSLSPKQYQNINSSYSIQPNDDFIFVDTSFSDIVLSLPSALNLGGKQLNIKKKSGNYKLTIQSLGSETIDNSNLFIIYNNYQSITLVSDNNNWFIV